MDLNIGFSKISVLDNHELLIAEEGHVAIATVLTQASANLYGNIHGGAIFTLCDSVAGNVARSYGADVVTLDSEIHYLAGLHVNEKVVVDGKCIHNGKGTKVVSVSVRDSEGKEHAVGTFTMYVTK